MLFWYWYWHSIHIFRLAFIAYRGLRALTHFIFNLSSFALSPSLLLIAHSAVLLVAGCKWLTCR